MNKSSTKPIILFLKIRLQTEGEFKTNNYTESRDINMIFKVFVQSKNEEKNNVSCNKKLIVPI